MRNLLRAISIFASFAFLGLITWGKHMPDLDTILLSFTAAQVKLAAPPVLLAIVLSGGAAAFMLFELGRHFLSRRH